MPENQSSSPVRDRLLIAPAAGMTCGACLGILESIAIILKDSTVRISILPYSVLLYGLVGLGFGIGIGIVLAILGGAILKRKLAPSRIFAFTAAAVFFMNGLPITRYRIFRDFLKEKSFPAWGMVTLLAAFLILFLLIRLLLNRLLHNRRPVITGIITFIGIFLVAVILTFAASGWRAPARNAADLTLLKNSENKPNIILLMIDALRYDYLNCYGYQTAISPNIDALAKDAVLYERMITQSSWTRPSTATILTGLYPSSHNTYRKPDILPDDIVTIAERLRGSGYYTCGFANNINVAPDFNFQQGFHDYFYLAPDFFFSADSSSSRLAYYSILRLVRERFLSKHKQVKHYYQSAETVTDGVLSWVKNKKNNFAFFLFVHYMEPHDPYFKHPFDGVGYARVSMPNPPAQKAPELKQTYEQEIAYLDQSLGKLFQYLIKEGIYNNSLIILTADHGEEFYEHEGWWHGTSLYEEQVRVPLIVKFPDNRLAGERVSDAVRSIDIVPTILGESRTEIPDSLPGIDLVKNHHNLKNAIPHVYSEEDFEGNVIHSVRTPEWKLIRSAEGGSRILPEVELFNLIQDPDEKNNLAESNWSKVQELDLLLKNYILTATGNQVDRTTAKIDEETRRRMESLGYIGD